MQNIHYYLRAYGFEPRQLVSLIRHAETLISLQWYVLILTLRLAVYTLFGKARSNLGKNYLHPPKYALPYTYGDVIVISANKTAIPRNKSAKLQASGF